MVPPRCASMIRADLMRWIVSSFVCAGGFACLDACGKIRKQFGAEQRAQRVEIAAAVGKDDHFKRAARALHETVDFKIAVDVGNVAQPRLDAAVLIGSGVDMAFGTGERHHILAHRLALQKDALGFVSDGLFLFGRGVERIAALALFAMAAAQNGVQAVNQKRRDQRENQNINVHVGNAPVW